MSVNNTNNKTNTDQNNTRHKDVIKKAQACKTLPQSNIIGKRKEVFNLKPLKDKKSEN